MTLITNLLRDRVTMRRVLFILACSLLGMALAAFYVAQAPPVYQASASVLVTSVTRDNADAGGANPLTETNDAQQKVLTLTQLATSNVVIERVITTMGLDLTPEDLRGRVTAEALPQTVVIRISAQDLDRGRAREIANTVALELDGYVQELNEQTSGSAATTTARLVDPALTPDAPLSPQPAIMLGLGFVGGLAGGLILTTAVARRDDLIRSESRVEQASGAPSLGSVPRVIGRRLTPASVAVHESTVQSFKGIRNNLLQRLPATSKPVVTVVSSESGEGKTSLTLGLAHALASDGLSVLVVDGDLRQRALTSALELDDRLGWVNSSESPNPVSELVVKDALESVDVVAVGVHRPTQRSGDRGLEGGSRQLQEVLDHLREDYDVVLVDTANLNSYADSALISRDADGALLVVPSGQVGPRQITLALASVTKAGGDVLGTVLNFAPRSPHD